MQKIISLYQRNYDGDRLVRDEVVPGAEWVIAGEGTATRKFDGTCVLIEDGTMWKRYEVKPGKQPPPGFRAANDIDDVTGKQQGWVPVGHGAEDQWHHDALAHSDCDLSDYENGTYELVGPKIQGNPEGFSRHMLLRHGASLLPGAPRTFDAIRGYLGVVDSEGIVWHHPDGRMVKIKGKDFGLKRPGGRTTERPQL